MALDSYQHFQNEIANQIVRSDMTTQIVDAITLFEAEASYELFRTRGTETKTILVPSNPASLAVTGAANNGSGLIRLTISSSATLTTNQEVNVSNVGGTAEANGSWLVTVIDGTHIDLQSSTFTNTYTAGGTVTALAGEVALPTDFLGWRRVTWTGSPRQELEYLDPDAFNAYYPDRPSGMPAHFTVEGSTLKIMPASGTPLEFDYWGKTPALSGSLNWLFTNRVDAYWHGVLGLMYNYLQDYEKSAVHLQKKLEIFQSIKMQRFREKSDLTVRVVGPIA